MDNMDPYGHRMPVHVELYRHLDTAKWTYGGYIELEPMNKWTKEPMIDEQWYTETMKQETYGDFMEETYQWVLMDHLVFSALASNITIHDNIFLAIYKYIINTTKNTVNSLDNLKSLIIPGMMDFETNYW